MEVKNKCGNVPNKTCQFQQHFKLIFISVFNEGLAFITLEKKTWKKCGNAFPHQKSLGASFPPPTPLVGTDIEYETTESSVVFAHSVFHICSGQYAELLSMELVVPSRQTEMGASTGASLASHQV